MGLFPHHYEVASIELVCEKSDSGEASTTAVGELGVNGVALSLQFFSRSVNFVPLCFGVVELHV